VKVGDVSSRRASRLLEPERWTSRRRVARLLLAPTAESGGRPVRWDAIRVESVRDRGQALTGCSFMPDSVDHVRDIFGGRPSGTP
jgi:hypothetical protein